MYFLLTRKSLFRLLILFGVCLHPFSHAEVKTLKPGCFELGKKKVKPLREPILLTHGTDVGAFGKMKNGVSWGAARGIVKKSIRDVYNRLLDHRTLKDMSKTELKTTVSKLEGFLAVHRVEVKLNIWAFISASWVEQWGYVLTKGTRAKPQEILIVYQKVGGTNKLEHLCGSFVLQSLSPEKTDVFLYEQLKAPARSGKDTQQMHLHTMGILRSNPHG